MRAGPNGRCAVCLHPEVARIELLLAARASKRAVGAKFALHPDAVWRHWRNHVHEERKAELIAGPVKIHELVERATAEGLTVLDHLHLVRRLLVGQFVAACNASDRYGAAVLAARLVGVLKAIGGFTGQIAQVGAVHVTNNNFFSDPRFATLQAVLVRTLAKHPEARADVITAFRELELGAASGSPMIEAGPVVSDDARAA